MVIKERSSSYTGVRTFEQDPTGFCAISRVEPKPKRSIETRGVIFAGTMPILNKPTIEIPGKNDINKGMAIYKRQVRLSELNRKGLLTPAEKQEKKEIRAEIKNLQHPEIQRREGRRKRRFELKKTHVKKN